MSMTGRGPFSRRGLAKITPRVSRPRRPYSTEILIVLPGQVMSQHFRTTHHQASCFERSHARGRQCRGEWFTLSGSLSTPRALSDI